MTCFEIAGRKIGPDHPPYVIAEVGINHEGDIKKALACVDAAVASGAEVVKFQCHIADKEMIPTDMTPGDISDEKLYDIIERCELTEAEEREVQKYCETKGILYLSTPFSREAADRLYGMGVPAFKIGSGECNNLPLLDHIAAMGRPMILSTGMNDIASIRASVKVIKKHNVPLALMHCTSIYPTPYSLVRLGAIGDLQRAFPDTVVGLSDHSMDIYTCLGAVALGASILEKHFTVTRDWPGPDVPISINPLELKRLIEGSRAIWESNNGQKTRLAEEQPVIDFAYASVVTIKPIAQGDVFTLENIWVKRPGTGEMLTDEFEAVLGKRARHSLEAEVQLQRRDIEG